jgi:hypothetical protein
MPTPFNNRARVGGSGFTIFTFAGQPIAFCQQVAETSPTPVGPGPVAIHPLDEPYPVQVITPAASGMGSITLNLYELYNEKVWDRLASDVNGSTSNPFGGVNSNDINTQNGLFDGAVDLVDVFIRQAEYSGNLNVVKYIRPPMIGGRKGQPYAEQYHGCVITNIVDGEQVEVGTMEIIKQVTVAYRFKTRNDRRSKAFEYRDRAIK